MRGKGGIERERESCKGRNKTRRERESLKRDPSEREEREAGGTEEREARRGILGAIWTGTFLSVGWPLFLSHESR